METSERLHGVGEYYFSTKLREIEALNQAGKQIINLGIGSPDQPPHLDVLAVLQQESAKAHTHAYQSYKGSPIFRQAVASWYQQHYGVALDFNTEILPLLGSKEGIMHLCMTYLNPGDGVLVPNPGYPTYRSAVTLAGGTCIDYTLTEAQDWLPDFEAMEQQDLSGVKLMFMNYPHMPTGQLPSSNLFDRAVAFAQKHQILLVHDNPYSFILNDSPASILKADGALEVAVELNSLSKSHNMAGWRVGVLCGSQTVINQVLRFKSNMDSGMFLPVQLAAAKALSLGQSWYTAVSAEYALRRQKAVELLQALQCTFSSQQAGMFMWAKVPAGFADGYAISDAVLYGANVFLTPGGIFGSQGNHYLRISLCSPVANIEQAIHRIKNAGLASA
ncbi:MAG: aminotransferase class I/II-fold pyridoxal phosphate-dependent enzyme [Bacteroidetes bacterium]|nr:MAG: aminotransferase class I/II-fold pyridoxal phosphate-dependent enzyme [Bacteroidota bacterium]